MSENKFNKNFTDNNGEFNSNLILKKNINSFLTMNIKYFELPLNSYKENKNKPVAFVDIYQDNIFVTVFAALGIILSGVYSLWLFNRIAYGPVKMQNIDIFLDINYREFMILSPLFFLTLFLGFYPDFILNKLHLLQIY